MRQRVMGYLDGFNLYFGLLTRSWERLLWLDPAALVEKLLKPHQDLVSVKYFTARLSGPGHRWEEQKVYLEALEQLGRCSLHFGQYQTEHHRCRHCGKDAAIQSEKMTDVNIATEIVADALLNQFDTAILVSGDGDLAPALLKVKELSPKQRIIVAFPPKRGSSLLRKAAHGCFTIDRANLLGSQMPDRMEKADGIVLERPQAWR